MNKRERALELSDSTLRHWVDRHVSFGQKAIDACVASAQLVGVPHDDEEKTCLMQLHLTVIDLYSDCLALVRATTPAAALPIIVRSIYEALVDQINLARIPNYHRYIEAANAAQMLKFVGAAARNNPLLAGSTLASDAETGAHFQSKLDELKKQGFPPLQPYQKFSKAGLTNEYETVYALYCVDSHNNLAALAERHVDDDAANPTLKVLAAPHLPSLAMRLNAATKFLVDSALVLHDATKTNAAAPEELRLQANEETMELQAHIRHREARIKATTPTPTAAS